MPREPDIRFEPVTPAHYALLRRWLEGPHMRQWWGEPADELDKIVDMVEQRDRFQHPFIFSVDGRPAGYIQYWHIGPHQTEEWTTDNPWLMELDAATVGVDIAIGEEANLARGLGSTVLKRFVKMLREMGHQTIIIDPDPENRRAVRAYEKAGFQLLPHLAGRTEGVLIMHHVPQAELRAT